MLLNPRNCPACGREAHFCYSTVDEALKQTPLCWAEDEQECYRFAARHGKQELARLEESNGK